MVRNFLRKCLQRPLGVPLAVEVSAGAVIFRQGLEVREYLLLQYPYGYWDYVKGHVEENETLEETLARETEEESGLKLKKIVKGFREVSRYCYVAKGRERVRRKAEKKGFWIFKTVYFYVAEAAEGTVTVSHEHIGYEWLPFEMAIKRLQFPRSKEILQKAEDFLNNK